MNEQIIFDLEILTSEKIASLRILILIRNESQQDNIISLEHDAIDSEILGGKKVNLRINLDQHNLMPGSYPIYFWAGTTDHLHFDVLDDLLPPLQISDENSYTQTQNSLCQSKSSLELISSL